MFWLINITLHADLLCCPFFSTLQATIYFIYFSEVFFWCKNRGGPKNVNSILFCNLPKTAAGRFTVKKAEEAEE